MATKPHIFHVRKPKGEKDEQKFQDFLLALSKYSDNVESDRDSYIDVKVVMIPHEEIDLKALKAFTKQGY